MIADSKTGWNTSCTWSSYAFARLFIRLICWVAEGGVIQIGIGEPERRRSPEKIRVFGKANDDTEDF